MLVSAHVQYQPCRGRAHPHHARLDPDLFLLAGRYTLLEQEPLEVLFPACARRGVGIVAGAPLNSGILAGKTTYNYSAAPPHIVARVRRLQAVCDRH